MTSYFNDCDVTVANSNYKICYNFFNVHLWPPTLKKVPLPMGRIIPEVCCVTKAAIKNVHFCTELSKVAALVATSTCLFSCCNSSSVEITAGNSCHENDNRVMSFYPVCSANWFQLLSRRSRA